MLVGEMLTRRSVFGGFGPRRAGGVYGELGVRPLINFQGTMTTIGASKMLPEVNAAMAEASREYVVLEELQERVGARLARLCGTEAAMVTSGAAAALALGTYGCLTGTDAAKVRALPDLTGMRKNAVVLKAHRNGYDHAVRSAGLRLLEAASLAELEAALANDAAVFYWLGGTSHDWEWEAPLGLTESLAAARRARVPMLVDAANMLPGWENIPRLAAAGVDLIAVSGGKHIRGPQSSGILAGRADLVKAAMANGSPQSDSQGRGMKVNREEMVGLWVAVERYAKLDFAALERACARQADYLIEGFRAMGLKAERTPFDRTRRVHRVRIGWETGRSRLTVGAVVEALMAGNPRIAVAVHAGAIEFTCFMNEAGDERVALRRMREIFG